MTYHFNPSLLNYYDLNELFKELGNDYDISWNNAQDENGVYIHPIVITARKVER
jgi:hypothetical protein